MEYFLVFSLGIAAAVVVVFVLRPSLFTRPSLDFSMFEAMVEESIAELEKRQEEIVREIEEKHQALLELQEQILARFVPPDTQSPKVLAVLELAREDSDVKNIAKKLGLGVGEVQLILELNKDYDPLVKSD
jgi:rRNA maturation endonuclease Nob1